MSMPPPPPPPPPPPLDRYGSVSGPTSPAGEPLANAGVRVLARLLDGVILGLISFLVALALFGRDSAGFDGIGGKASFADVYVVSLIGVVVAFVWDAVMTRLYGGTPMKLAFGMRVVRADNGQQVEWSHAITRWAIPSSFALIPLPVLPGLLQAIVVIVSLVYIFSRPLRQAVWDQVAKTLVVKRAG